MFLFFYYNTRLCVFASFLTCFFYLQLYTHSYDTKIKIKEFYIEISHILREYVENSVYIKSLEMTTEEITRNRDSFPFNKEEIDYIILAHNIGDITFESNQVDVLPSIASRVKSGLEINNPSCVAYDIIFGCPGWLEGVIQASAFIKSKIAKTCLVIGSETLSRVLDKSDRDSMIYADGAGASIIQTSNEKGGILSHKSASYTSNSENSTYIMEPLITEILKKLNLLKCKVERYMNLH